MSILSSLFRRTPHIDLRGRTDWHSHILPGVDDGMQTVEESLQVLSNYEQLGIADVWLTPHIMEDMPNTTEALRQRFDQLRSRYSGPVRLHLAAENMIDRLFIDRLEADDLLPIGENLDMLLVETSYFNPPINLRKTLGKIMDRGYYPLLAHPERYSYIDSVKGYRRLKEMGVRFQLNILSLQGYYGRQARDKARDLMSKGMYDLYGTDIHRPAQIRDFMP